MGATEKFNELLKFTNLQNQYNNLKNTDLNGDGVVDKKDTKLFKRLDENSDLNGDGKINKKDKALFKNLDTNSDGKINSKDLKDINKEIKNLLKSDETFDLNGDNILDAKDFVKFMKLISNDKTKKKYNLTDDMIESLTKTFVEKTLDSDNNGQINIVDLEYFGKMLDNLNSYNESQSTWDLGDFSKKDVNLNGDKKVNQDDATVLKDTVISAIEKYTGISLDFVTPSQQASDVNGEIDDFKQGKINDCWLLAGIEALAASKKGVKIIKDSIKANDDGSVTITFKGLGVSYTITSDELQKYDKHVDYSKLKVGDFSIGDNDILAFELATDKLQKDIKSGKVTTGNTDKDMIKGGCHRRKQKDTITDCGYSEWIIYYLTGAKSQWYYNPNDEFMKKNQIINALNHVTEDSAALTFSIGASKNKINCTDKDGNKVEFELNIDSGHCLSIKKVDKEAQTVTFVNPWDNSKEYTTSFSEFSKLHIWRIEITDMNDAHLKSENKEMTNYLPPENKQYIDEKGNSVVDKYITLHGERVLQQRTVTASDGTITIEKYEDLDRFANINVELNRSYLSNGRYDHVVKQKIVISPNGVTTTTNYEYELIDEMTKKDDSSDVNLPFVSMLTGKYVLKYSSSTSSDGVNTTSIYDTIEGKRYETKRTVTKDGITTTYNYKIANGKRYLTSVVKKDNNDTVTETNYKTDSDGTSKEDTRTVTDKNGNRTYYKFKMVDGKWTPVETAKSKYKEDIKWGETQGSYEIRTDNKNKTSVIIRNKQGKKLANINISDYTNDFVSAKVQNIYSFNDNKMLSKSVITIKCSDSSTITITLEFDKDGKETKRDVAKS